MMVRRDSGDRADSAIGHADFLRPAFHGKIGRCDRSTLVLIRISVLVCSVALASVALGSRGEGFQDDWLPVRVRLVSESLMDAGIADLEFGFLSIDDPAASKSIRLRLSELSSLQLVQDPEADAVSTVGELIQQLDHPAWEQRQQAESELAKLVKRPEVRAVIEQASTAPSLEVRHRARRLLQSAGTGGVLSAQVRLRYDRVYLKDGRSFRGDAGPLSVVIRWRGEEIRLTREQLAALVFQPLAPLRLPVATEVPANANAAVDWLPRLENRALPDQPNPAVFLDFESGFEGRRLTRLDNVTTEFLDRGLMIRAERDNKTPRATVLISPYVFNHENKPTGGNSICVSHEEGSIRSAFRGNTILDFCLPSQPTATAGVQRVQMYASRVDFPLAIVMQCLNADGQLLAEVESSDDECSWFGVESGEPIAQVRVLANPLSLQMEQQIDDDYAIDNLGHSLPVAIPPIKAGPQGVLATRTGEWIVVDRVIAGPDGFSGREVTTGKNLQWTTAEVAWWIQPGSQIVAPDRASERWFAMLDDRSVLEVSCRGDRLVATSFPGLPIGADNLAALWSGRDWCRFPVRGDFGFGSQVLVFPACRVATSQVSWGAEGLAWSEQDQTPLFQPLMISRQAGTPEDPTGKLLAADPLLAPAFHTLAWSDPNQWNLPTVWFRSPPPVRTERGSISFRNGESCSIGDGCQFRIRSMNESSFILEGADGSATELPWESVWRVVLPGTAP